MAQLTPSVIQQENSVVSYGISGTPVQTETFLLKVTKATQNDTVVMTTALDTKYTTDKIIMFDAVTIPAGGDAVKEEPTLDDSDDEVVLPSATVGTSWIKVTYGF